MQAVRTDYCDLKELAARVPLNRRKLKTVINQRRENGLYQYVRRVGRSLYVSESGFYEWLDQQKEECQ